MKKVLATLVCTVCISIQASAQGDFRGGAHIGLAIGDTSDFASLILGLDASYLWPIDDVFAAGAATGYSNYLGKDDYSNYSFIPLAASGRADFSAMWFGTLDLGYAIAIDDAGGDGGFYYQPKIGWTDGSFDAFLFYQGVSVKDAEFDVSGIGVGGAFKF